MKLYKDLQNKIHSIEQEYAHLLPAGCVEITQAEADILTAPTPAEIAAQVAADAQRLADQNAIASAKADVVIQYLVSHTPAECANKVATDVTNLATAVAMLQKFAIALCVLSKDKLR